MYETRYAKGVVIERNKCVYGESDADTAEKGLERGGRHSERGGYMLRGVNVILEKSDVLQIRVFLPR